MYSKGKKCLYWADESGKGMIKISCTGTTSPRKDPFHLYSLSPHLPQFNGHQGPPLSSLSACTLPQLSTEIMRLDTITKGSPLPLSNSYLRVRHSSVGSVSGCCKAAPSSNLDSAPQWRPSTWAYSNEETGAELSECYEWVWNLYECTVNNEEN